MGHVAFSGNLVDHPQVKNVKGTNLAEFRVASTPRLNIDGRWTNGETIYIDVTAWRQLGEHVMASCKKGTRVVVTGEASTRTYTKKDGSEATATQVQAEDVGVSLMFNPAQPDKRSQSERGLTTVKEALGASVIETVPAF